MNVKIAVTFGAFLFAACGGESDDFQENDLELIDRVDSCDLRSTFGTCLQYTLSELDDWDREYVERVCPRHRRGDLAGKYVKDSRCPTDNRVARCEDIVDDPTEPFEYDKHYYHHTNELYSWKPEAIKVSCDNVSGQFVPE